MTAELLRAAEALDPRVRELAPTIEAERRLAPELAEAFGKAGFWRACIPRQAGGLEVPLREQLAAFEALARADGSAGWCAMIAATAGVVYAYLDPATAAELVRANPEASTAGVFAPTGTAEDDDGGVRVNGRWRFASGVGHADRITLGVLPTTGGAPRTTASGAPEIAAVLLDAADIEIVDTWTVSGLRGTGSHDVVVRDVVVPRERLYSIMGERRHDGALYAFPVFGLLALGVGAVCLGIARSAIDELRELAGGKTPTGARRRLADRAHVQMEVAQAVAELEAARAFVADAVDEAWAGAEAGHEPTLEQRARLRLAATNAARGSARVVDRMYEAGGGSSVYAQSRLQRDFRDVHACTQHMVVAPPTWELTGRVLLGVETDVSQL